MPVATSSGLTCSRCAWVQHPASHRSRTSTHFLGSHVAQGPSGPVISPLRTQPKAAARDAQRFLVTEGHHGFVINSKTQTGRKEPEQMSQNRKTLNKWRCWGADHYMCSKHRTLKRDWERTRGRSSRWERPDTPRPAHYDEQIVQTQIWTHAQRKDGWNMKALTAAISGWQNYQWFIFSCHFLWCFPFDSEHKCNFVTRKK